MAHTEGFNPTSGHSTIPFDRDEGEDKDDDNIPCVPDPHHDILSSSAPLPIDDFTFTKDHYNLFNGRINSLALSVDRLDGLLH